MKITWMRVVTRKICTAVAILDFMGLMVPKPLFKMLKRWSMIYRTEHRFLEHLLKTMNLIVPIHTNLCRLLYAHHRFSTWRPVDSCARGWCCFPWFFCGLRCYIYVGINDVDEACFCARNPPQTTFMFSELKKTMSTSYNLNHHQTSRHTGTSTR